MKSWQGAHLKFMIEELDHGALKMQAGKSSKLFKAKLKNSTMKKFN